MYEIRVGGTRYVWLWWWWWWRHHVGAAGAIWGSSQVYLLRYDGRASTDNPWIDWAMVVGVFGVVRYAILYFNVDQIVKFRASVKLHHPRDISYFKAFIMAMETPFGAIIYALCGHGDDTYTPMQWNDSIYVVVFMIMVYVDAVDSLIRNWCKAWCRRWLFVFPSRCTTYDSE